MSAKHTPGPWATVKQLNGIEIVDSQDRLIAIGTGENWGQWRDAEDDGKAEFEANARVIAAAPDLMAALKEVIDWINNWSPNFVMDDEWPDTAEKLRNAIAKAEGH